MLSHPFIPVALKRWAIAIATPLFLQSINLPLSAVAADIPNLPKPVRSNAETQRSEYVTTVFDLSGTSLAQVEGEIKEFSADGQYFLIAFGDSRGYALFQRSGHKRLQLDVGIVKLSPDGKTLVSERFNQSQLYSSTGKRLAELPGQDASFSQNGQLILTSTYESFYLSEASGKRLAQISGSPFPPSLGLESFAVTSRHLTVTRSREWQKKIVTTCNFLDASGKTIAEFPQVCGGFSPNGDKFVVLNGTQSENVDASLYDLSGRKLNTLKGEVVRFSPDGNLILTHARLSSSESYLYNSVGQKIALLQGESGRFSSTSLRIITVSSQGIHLYNSAGQELARLPGQRAAFLPKTDRIVTVGEVKTSDLPRSSRVEPICHDPASIKKQAVSLEKRELQKPSQIAAVSNTAAQPNASSKESPKEIRLFDLTSCKSTVLKGSFDAYFMELSGAGGSNLQNSQDYLPFLSPDGERVITSEAGTIYLYSASGQLVAQLPGQFLQFDATGKYGLAKMRDEVYVFDRSGRQIMKTKGEFGLFSPNGQSVAISAKQAIDF
ncbi:hypothetical protein [Alkalinema sp. FACHB-956]|uniref:WD40 repeat domain-containing protein n=1 Tax=Alkalinema sp. FACHB-956 TaxID=2692768 RepID=UPI00168945CE|nr:hypothetical protein [Alkalinema sp. FACHB-956]MBD2327700.1 hypothetical protein [Alkalinema sp. FACHB-956]